MNSIPQGQLELVIGQIVAATMRPDLVTAQVLRPSSKRFLELSSDTLAALLVKETEGNDLGLPKTFALPLNRRAIHIRSDRLDHETQEAQDRRATQRDQNVRAGMPFGGEVEPIHLVELGHKRQQP